MTGVYADYAAATPTDPRVVDRVAEISAKFVGNPSSLHSFGTAAAKVLDESRQSVATFLHCQIDEVFFTSSGTESNNLAILGVARANSKQGNHIITSNIEHPSILNACRTLEREGFEVTYLPVDANGLVSGERLAKTLRPETILVSIHLANSEIGVIQNIADLVEIAKERKVLFHTDACQAATYLELDTHALGVDLLTFNGSKLYGPRGVAVLFVQSGVTIFPLIYGGGQEQSLRSGTENIPGIAGLALACQIATDCRFKDFGRVGQLRDELQEKLIAADCLINVKEAPRLPNHLSVIIPSTETNVVAALDRAGVAVSSGSACSSRAQTDSHVLAALGLTSEQINKTIRISLGRQTTGEDCVKIADEIKK